MATISDLFLRIEERRTTPRDAHLVEITFSLDFSAGETLWLSSNNGRVHIAVWLRGADKGFRGSDDSLFFISDTLETVSPGLNSDLDRPPLSNRINFSQWVESEYLDEDKDRLLPRTDEVYARVLLSMSRNRTTGRIIADWINSNTVTDTF